MAKWFFTVSKSIAEAIPAGAGAGAAEVPEGTEATEDPKLEEDPNAEGVTVPGEEGTLPEGNGDIVGEDTGDDVGEDTGDDAGGAEITAPQLGQVEEEGGKENWQRGQ